MTGTGPGANLANGKLRNVAGPFESYLDSWRARWKALRDRERQRAGRARAALPGMVDILVRHGARRVVLFGSLARGRFGLDSDVDLAVDGVADPFGAADELERLGDFAVDVVPLEAALPHICARVEREGVVLHERAG